MQISVIAILPIKLPGSDQYIARGAPS